MSQTRQDFYDTDFIDYDDGHYGSEEEEAAEEEEKVTKESRQLPLKPRYVVIRFSLHPCSTRSGSPELTKATSDSHER